MALDPLLFGTYKRYKAGTSRVTTWLASKAKDMNLSNDLFPAICGNKGMGKLKGKARAAQKENGQTYQVALADIPRIAEAIASKSKVTVPGRIIQTLEEVIAARTAYNACFEQQGPTDNSTQSSNRKHQHFIGILRQTLDILKPQSKDSDQSNETTGETAKTGADKGVADLGNIFEYLEVDEPTEWTSS